MRSKQLTKRVGLFFACIAVVIICIVIITVTGCVKGGSRAYKENAADEASSADADAGIMENMETAVNEADIDYDKDENTIDEEKYKDTVLAESEDAGDDYINDTLFIGDSNTVRMMGLGYTSLENTIAVVGMGIQSVKTLKCIEFSGYSSPVTMIEAVKLIQPRRIIITFGTNNANGMDTDTFIKKYDEALDAIEEAYPYADILINSVPPFAIKNSYPKLSISSIDKFNVALSEMAEKRGLKFINSSSVMKDEETGYAKSSFMAGDGIHITKEGFEAMFKYIRTHSHIVKDTRPKPLNPIPKQVKATFVIGGDGKMRNDKSSYEMLSVQSGTLPTTDSLSGSEAPEVLNTPALTSSSESVQTSEPVSSSSTQKQCEHRFNSGKIIKEATTEEEGKKEFTCEICGYSYTEKIPKKEKPAPAPEPETPEAPDTPTDPEPTEPEAPVNPNPEPEPEPTPQEPTEPEQPTEPETPPENPEPAPREPDVEEVTPAESEPSDGA